MGCGSGTESRTANTVNYVSKEDAIIKGTKRFMDYYELNRKRGVGTYSEVWSVIHKGTKNHRAVKIIKKSLSKKHTKLQEMLHGEFEALAKMDSPNIMKIYETFEDNYKYYIVLEEMEGMNLLEYIKKMEQRKFTEKLVAGLMKQVLIGINHCHSHGFVHRDIKPENLVFKDKENTILKINREE